MKDLRTSHQEGTSPFEVGDILVESWGYDQTNIDFYQIVRTSEKSVWIKEIAARQISSNGYQDQLVAAPGQFIERGYVRGGGKDNGGGRAKRVQWAEWGNQPRPYVTISSYSNAYPWNGEVENQTGAGFGH